MAHCPYCKTEFLPDHNFCGTCGTDLLSVVNQMNEPNQRVQVQPYYISPTKIILMAFLTNGLYLFYWFYVTWKHYQDTTGESVYPVWHALSLIVPIYNLFRIYKHVQTFKTLMSDRNLPNSLHPFWTIILFIVLSLLDWFSFQNAINDITNRTIVTASFLNLLSAVALSGMLIQLQKNFNDYWDSLLEAVSGKSNLTAAKITMPEIILVGIGLLTWLEPLMLIFNPS